MRLHIHAHSLPFDHSLELTNTFFLKKKIPAENTQLGVSVEFPSKEDAANFPFPSGVGYSSSWPGCYMRVGALNIHSFRQYQELQQYIARIKSTGFRVVGWRLCFHFFPHMHSLNITACGLPQCTFKWELFEKEIETKFSFAQDNAHIQVPGFAITVSEIAQQGNFFFYYYCVGKGSLSAIKYLKNM